MRDLEEGATTIRLHTGREILLGERLSSSQVGLRLVEMARFVQRRKILLSTYAYTARGWLIF
jgi:hypothetical protein